MRRLSLTIVPPMPIAAAEEKLAEFRKQQPALWGILSQVDVEVLNVRGGQEGGRIVAKRGYRISISERDAVLFHASYDPTPIEVMVVPLGPADLAEREFKEWWRRHAELRAQLGESGVVLDVSHLGGSEQRQYRVFVAPRFMPLLASSSSIA
jgi:hypothetical protein